MKTTIALNESQLDVLSFIAKYRLVRVSHIQKQFDYKSRTSIHNKLKRLIGAELVGMQYDNSKKLSGIPAAFYLTPKGLRAVRVRLPYITAGIVKGSYKDSNASDNLIQESSAIFELAQSLTRNYHGMKALTARQLGDLEYFPRPLPNLYLAHNTSDETARYFLYHLGDKKRYDIDVKSTIKKVIAYRESDTYSVSGNEFPTILLVCGTPAIARLAQRVMRAVLNKSYESLLVYTASHQAVTTQENIDQPIWASIDDPNTLISLADIES